MRFSVGRAEAEFRWRCFAMAHAATRLHVIKNGILKSNSLNLDRNLNQQNNMFSGVISSVLRGGGRVKININFGADSRLTKCWEN